MSLAVVARVVCLSLVEDLCREPVPIVLASRRVTLGDTVEYNI